MKSAYEKLRRLPIVGSFVEELASPFAQGYVLTVKRALDAISPSICAAKWYQSTIYLESGETHSCHHPPRHRIPTEGLAQDPRGLHNTPQKKEQRRLMLQGARPRECEYCWKVEDAGGLSDRHYKSAEDWARGMVPGLAGLRGDEAVDPRYLEVSFSSLCQLKCSYCDPTISSSIAAEIEKYGPYPTSESFGRFTRESVDQGALARAFWEWWPQLREKLEVLRLTGGEPLLHDDLNRLLTDLQGNPAPRLKLSVTSNLMVAPARLESFLGQVEGLLSRRAVKSVHLYTSIDTWGEQAEWLRAGLKLPLFTENVEALLRRLPTIELTFLVTFNLLSLFRFRELLEYVLWLRGRYPAAKLKVGVSYLHYPHFLSVDVLPRSKAHFFQDIQAFYRANSVAARGSSGFSPSEIERFERIYHVWRGSVVRPGALEDLKSFIHHYDQRKNLNFAAAFPDFWQRIEA